MPLKSILIVDDNPVDLEIVSIACSSLDCEIDIAKTASEALSKYKKGKYALVLSDYMMEPQNGIDLIKLIKAHNPSAQCLLMSGFADAKANQFLIEREMLPIIKKPIRMANLIEQIRLALNKDQGATNRLGDVRLSNQMDRCIPLMGESREICKVRKQIAKLIDAPQPILIEGPIGVGKLDLATFIHQSGSYGDSGLNTYDFAGKESDQVEAAIISQEGALGEIVEKAKTGTLILKNIESLSLKLQQLLARHFKIIASQCKLIIISDVKIDTLYDQQSIDEFLYFEISLDGMYLPPLTERPTDLEIIVRHLLKSKSNAGGRTLTSVETDALVADLRRRPLERNITEVIEVLELFLAEQARV